MPHQSTAGPGTCLWVEKKGVIHRHGERFAGDQEQVVRGKECVPSQRNNQANEEKRE